MMEVTVITEVELESGKILKVWENPDYQTIFLQIGNGAAIEMEKEEAEGIGRLLTTYANGFEWPPAPVLPQVDQHEAFKEIYPLIDKK